MSWQPQKDACEKALILLMAEREAIDTAIKALHVVQAFGEMHKLTALMPDPPEAADTALYSEGREDEMAGQQDKLDP